MKEKIKGERIIVQRILLIINFIPLSLPVSFVYLRQTNGERRRFYKNYEQE